MAEMLPKDCPFCGSDKVDICRTNPNACWVRCANCYADAPSDRTRIGALKNWNRRDGLGLTASIAEDDDRTRWTPAQKRAKA
jgi:hypothetical protein